jgi:hypothetical protein
MSRDSLVSSESDYRQDNRGSTSGRDKEFLWRLDRPVLTPPSFLSKGYDGRFPRKKKKKNEE